MSRRSWCKVRGWGTINISRIGERKQCAGQGPMAGGSMSIPLYITGIQCLLPIPPESRWFEYAILPIPERDRHFLSIAVTACSATSWESRSWRRGLTVWRQHHGRRDLVGVLQACGPAGQHSTQALSRFRSAPWLRFNCPSSFLLIHDPVLSPLEASTVSCLSLFCQLHWFWSVIRFQFSSPVWHSATPWLCG